MSRHLLLAMSTLVVLTAAACTSNGGAAPTASPEVDAPTSSPSPEATTRAPFIVVTPSPTPEVREPPEVRVLLVEPATGHIITPYDAASRLLSNRLTPRFTPDGAAIWISPVDGDGATRRGLDGTVLDDIPGAWAVRESVDGLTRIYLAAPDGVEPRVRVVERGEFRRTIDTFTVEGVPSPDGTRIAFRYWPDATSELLAIDVLDIPTGERWTIATDLGPCGCDGGPPPVWSPSGDFIAYVDFEAPRGNFEDDHGAYIVPVDAGPSIRRSDSGWFSDHWVLNEDGTDSVFYVEGPRLLRFDLASRATTLIYEAPDQENAAVGLLDDHIIRVTYPEERTDQRTILSTLSGSEIASWPGMADVVIGPNGPAASVINHGISPSRADLGCDGLWYDHPHLAEPGCIEGARWGVWSPDASYLVATIELDVFAHQTVVVNVISGERLTLPATREPVASIEWNPQNTHLLLSWGTGL